MYSMVSLIISVGELFSSCSDGGIYTEEIWWRTDTGHTDGERWDCSDGGFYVVGTGFGKYLP